MKAKSERKSGESATLSGSARVNRVHQVAGYLFATHQKQSYQTEVVLSHVFSKQSQSWAEFHISSSEQEKFGNEDHEDGEKAHSNLLGNRVLW